MAVRIGINPLSWFNSDIPSLGADIPIEQVLSEAALIGYQGIELEDRLAVALKANDQLLHQRGLRLVGGWFSTELLCNSIRKEKQRLREHIALLKRFGGGVVILADCSGAVHRQYETPLSKRPKLTESQWDQLASGLDELARIAESEGMVSAYHHHMGTVIQTAEEVQELLDRTTRIGLLLDVGHLAFAGDDVLQYMDRWASRTTHVHAKNVRLPVLEEHLKRDSSFFSAVMDGVFTVPGDAGLDFSPIIDRLIANSYSGWIVVEAEQDPIKAHPLTYAGLGKKALEYELARSQLRQLQRRQELVGA